MFSSAEKSAHVSRLQQPASTTFFRKAGEEPFFSPKNRSSSFSTPVQAKLSVSTPDDPQEKEADVVADSVMRMAEPAPVAALPANEEEKLERKEEKEEETVLAKAELPAFAVPGKGETVQSKVNKYVQRSPGIDTSVTAESDAKDETENKILPKSAPVCQSQVLQQSGGGTESSRDFEPQLSSTKGQGSPMPDSTREFMESRFNSDFSSVRIHTGSNAEHLSRSINAQAFTHGNDIYFNNGKYSPNTAEGGKLLAHELTHTVQQGASNAAQRKGAPAPPVPPPAEITSLTNGVFAPSESTAKYITEGRYAGKAINVSFGNFASGAIKVRKQKDAFETTGGQQGIPLQLPFLQPLVNAGIQPMLAVNIKDNNISGFLTVSVGKSQTIGREGAIFDWIKSNPLLMKWNGLSKLTAKKDNIINQIQGDKLRLEVKDIGVELGGFVKGSFSIGLINSSVTVEGNAIVTVKSLANGTLNFRRDELGDLRGNFDMQAQVKNFAGSVKGAFLNGIFDIHGTLRYSTEKLTGEVTIIVTDPRQAKAMVLQQLEPQQISKEAEERAGVSEGVSGPQPGPRAIAGWGTLNFAFNKWLTGSAKVIVDDEGYITVHGEITPPAEVKLFGAKPYRSPNFIDLHPTFRWGIPYVADLHVGLDFLLYAEAQIGPAVLRNIKIIGNYSTDPLLYNDFRVQGTFNLIGYAGLVFTFGAHAGVGILGFDIDLKGTISATAGIKGYVEATPVIGYREKADPVAGKKGEFFISGQAELAAQPFLKLEGAVGVEVDSPWPIPNFGRSWPVGDKEYPLPGQFGVGLTFGEYILGSNEWPDVDFNEINFDPEKFKDELIDRNIPPKEAHPEEKKGGFADKMQGKEVAPPPPPPAVAHKAAGGKPKEGKEAKPPTKEVLERWGNGMKALRSLKDQRDEKPVAKEVLMTELGAIRRKFKFAQLVADPSGMNWSVYAEMPGIDNAGAPIAIKGIAEADKQKDGKPSVDKTLEEKHTPEKAVKITEGIQHLHQLEKPLLNNGKITKEESLLVAKEVKKLHPVFASFNVIDGGDSWDYEYTASAPTRIEGEKKDLAPTVQVNVGDSIVDKKTNIGYRVIEINVKLSISAGERSGIWVKNDEGSKVFYPYEFFGKSNGWDKPDKPAFIGFSVSPSTPTIERTAMVRIDQEHLNKKSTSPHISPLKHVEAGYDTKMKWSRAGHLVPNVFGGPNGYESGNIVAMTYPANHTAVGMRGIEDAVLRDIRTTNAVYDYAVTPKYKNSQIPPVEVIVFVDRLYPTKTLPATVNSANKKIDNT